MSPKRQPKPDFVIRIVGDIRPWQVPLRPLTRVLNAVQRLIERKEDDQEESESGGGEEAGQHAPLHLIKITSGSAVYGVCGVTSPTAIEILAETGRCLGDPENSDYDPVILNPIEDISAAARTMDVDIELIHGEKILARITPRSFRDLSAGAYVVGESTLYGRVERVGGATEKRCGLRLTTQPSRMIYCQVATAELVRQLGQHVYEDVRVSGTVTWFRKNWRVKTIRIEGFEAPKKGSIREALNRAYEAGGKAWDDVADPLATIAEIRGT